MKVVLVTRKRRKVVDALDSIGRLLYNRLRRTGCDIVWCSDDAEPQVAEDADVVYHFGNRFHLDELVSTCAQKGCPILIHGGYGAEPSLEQDMMDRFVRYDTMHPNHVFLAVPCVDALYWSSPFSGRPFCDPLHLVVTPQLFRPIGSSSVLSFVERTGVCVGQVPPEAELNDSLLETVEEVSRALSNEVGPVVGYCLPDQKYPDLPHMRVVAQPADLASWHGSFRVFVSLWGEDAWGSRTMEALDAQAMAVPVVYPPTPGAMASSVGLTGFSPQRVDELVHVARSLYRNEWDWGHASRMSRNNAESHRAENQALGVRLALETVVSRSRDWKVS